MKELWRNFTTVGRFEPWVVMCRGLFCAMGHFELGLFMPWAILSLGRFVRVSFRDGRFEFGPI
jgi:hypothetical protein